jgi:2-polyprenyl-3-methyl-5-hydroxy-6-metoxy-1,4-benzoquinol methylase
MLERYLEVAPSTIVSDIGAGFGHMQQQVERLGARWQPFDYVKKIPQSTLWDLNYPAPQKAEKAGIVLFLEILEHLPNPLQSLRFVSDHLLSGGLLILSTPNPQSSKNRLNLLLKGQLYAFQEKHLKEHHVFTPWEYIVRFFLEQVGFEIQEYAIVDTAYRSRTPQNSKDRLKKMAERIIERRDPKAKGMSYGLIARKK